MISFDQTLQIKSLINNHSPIVAKIGSIDPAEYLTEERYGVVIACIRLKRVSWYQYELSRLVVEPARRNKGIGRALIRDACREVRRLGGLVAQCTVRDDNEASQRIFKCNGFVPGARFVGPSGNDLTVWQRSL